MNLVVAILIAVAAVWVAGFLFVWGVVAGAARIERREHDEDAR